MKIFEGFFLSTKFFVLSVFSFLFDVLGYVFNEFRRYRTERKLIGSEIKFINQDELMNCVKVIYLRMFPKIIS